MDFLYPDGGGLSRGHQRQITPIIGAMMETRAKGRLV
ncbi:hypothetical protein CKAH01_14331 [Colletotrichum kahawae]|uniref:Uncharacterized protein n=1 Tax=Colletotrichum kahawae TaxID=34407 RepID=A0AAE0DAE1_COLKA|nr:hypothetical protein CKAH01_14331 [Colletotrichum kahawae]